MTSLERLNDPRREGRISYDSNALSFLPTRPTVPLLIDYSPERVIGEVSQLFRHKDTDGFWYVAVARVAEQPSWLGRGTAASFAYYPVQTDSFGHNILRCGYMKEVSVLSPGVEPYESGARVEFVKSVEEPKPKPPKVQSPSVPLAQRSRAAGDAEIAEPHCRLERPGRTWSSRPCSRT